MMVRRWFVAIALASAGAPANAGPPYLTDDPAPTETGHWEIYAFTAGEGRSSALDEDVGLDLNYGLVKDVQLTATLPLSFSHAPQEGWHGGSGDLELAVKYRFIHDQRSGISAAIFPRAILATAAHSPGEKSRILLPLWFQKDFRGGTSIFGGGGYEVNPGSGNRNFWQAGATVTQELTPKLSIGAEITRQGAEAIDGASQTSTGIGTIYQLTDHYGLLLSAGPTWAEHHTSYHFYAAVGLFF